MTWKWDIFRVDSMVVSWWIVAFLPSDRYWKKGNGSLSLSLSPMLFDDA